MAHAGFVLSSLDVRNDILVPKYYDPAIEEHLSSLAPTHELLLIGDLIEEGHLQLRQGNYIGKMHYGTGRVPYIRTSDIANWELKGSPKHGVSEAIYSTFSGHQDVQPFDVLLVHEGTYLIGTPCLLTSFDTRIVYQHHLAKLRVLPGAPLTPQLLMAALLSPIVQRQIRSKQLTADTIDSIVGRIQEVVLPIPRDAEERRAIEVESQDVFEGRARARLLLSTLTNGLDAALRVGVDDLERTLESPPAEDASAVVGFLGDRLPAVSFLHSSEDVRNDVLIPRYYDPDIDLELERFRATCDLRTVANLADEGLLSLQTGDEVGKLAYGGGAIPFIRTSDLGNWELKHDPKQRVSVDVYEAYRSKQSVHANDILVVRDGTYLVGATSFVTESDLPLLISGGIYRVRSQDTEALSPYLLLALLSTTVVRRQMRAKQFTRDVIDTLGQRIHELVLPIPRSMAIRGWVDDRVRHLLQQRSELRRRAEQLGYLIDPGEQD